MPEQDTKFSELPVAIAVASPDFVAVVQGGDSKRADVSLFGGSFLSENISRVDPSGDDGTGAVGDLSKPFLTVQGAINAIQASAPIPDSPVIDIGDNSFTETLTTSLNTLIFVGRNSAAAAIPNSPFTDLTLTAPTGDITLVLKDCNAYDNSGFVHVPDAGSAGQNILCHLINARLTTIAYEGTAGGKLFLFGDGHSRLGFATCTDAVSGDIIANGFQYHERIDSSFNLSVTCSSTSDCFLHDCFIDSVFSAQTAVLFGTSVIANNSATATLYRVNPFFGSNGPVTVAYNRVTSQNAANASITTFPVYLESSFEVSMNINVSAATAISTSAKCDYTDENNVARSMILPVTGLTGSFLAGGLVIATGAFETPAMHIRCKAGTTITLYTATGTFTDVTYSAEGIIKQTQ